MDRRAGERWPGLTTMTGSASNSRNKARARRARLRAEGLRPVEIWVPDVRAPAKPECANRTSNVIAPNGRSFTSTPP